jgi:acetate kinase
MIIAIGNIGSTSIKSKIIDINSDNELKIIGEANLDKIKTEGDSNFTFRVGSGEKGKETINIIGYDNGIKFILEWYIKNKIIKKFQDIQAVGFKCILGVTNGANLLTPKILDEMKKYLFVAPVHNKPYIDAIKEFKKIIDVPMVGVFEPSFYYSIPEFRKLLGLPWEWHKFGIKKHGFHGSTHRYLSAMAYKIAGREDIKLLTVHLGGSSSICALENGKPVDQDSGFSPNSGLLHGTRVGDTDGTAILYAMNEMGLTVNEAQDQISNNSGLLGLAGIGTDDIMAIESAAENGSQRAQMALDFYIDGIRKHIAALSTVLKGLDYLVFGGGIGEKDTYIRGKVLEGMEYMGIKMDNVLNKQMNGKFGLISSGDPDKSRVKIYIIPTNEEAVVAYFTKEVVEKGRDLVPEEMQYRL